MSFHKPPPGDTVARLQPRVIKAGIMKKLSSAGWISENGVCYIFSFIDFYIVFVILSLPLVFVHWPAFNKKKKKKMFQLKSLASQLIFQIYSIKRNTEISKYHKGIQNTEDLICIMCSYI